jgi:putative two-component system response regulator
VTLFQNLLRDEFHDIDLRAAKSGQEALTLELPHAPSLVLLDIDLFPDQSGLAYLPRLKAKWPDSPIAMITFHDDPPYQRAAVEAGAVASLSKWQLAPESIRLTLQALGIDVARYGR